MKTFQVGKTYWTRSACDHECIFRVTVLKRTAKTITVDRSGKVKNLRVAVWNDVETVKPYGTYSMCPVIGADKEEA